MCGHCYPTSTVIISRTNNSNFDLASISLGASGNGTDEYDYTIQGNLAAGGTVIFNQTVTVAQGVVNVTLPPTFRDLSSVTVIADNTGNVFGASSIDDVEMHQTPTITYSPVSITPTGGGPNTDPKPVLFENVILNGVTYDVTINWNTTYTPLYTTPPMFEDSSFVTGARSQDVAAELRYALIRDGFTPVSPLGGLRMMVPGAVAFTGHWAATTSIDTPGLDLNDQYLYSSSGPPTVVDPLLGYARFSVHVESIVGTSNPGDSIHINHDGITSSLNDPIQVTVLGSGNDGEDLFFSTNGIVANSVRYGPVQGPTDPGKPPSYGLNVNADGDLDALFNFLTGDVGFECTDTEGTITGEATSGGLFQSTTDIVSECDAACH